MTLKDSTGTGTPKLLVWADPLEQRWVVFAIELKRT
jgi:hypothetical protein